MREKHLWALRDGAMTFEAFCLLEARYFRRMAASFYRRASWAHLPLEPEDLEQLGKMAVWKAVNTYLLLCPRCRRSTTVRADFEAHTRERHGEKLDPRRSLYLYAHGLVGHAMGHEVTRYTRREKFVGDLRRMLVDEQDQQREEELIPHEETPVGVIEMREMVKRAARELSAMDRAIVETLAHGYHPVWVSDVQINRAVRNARHVLEAEGT